MNHEGTAQNDHIRIAFLTLLAQNVWDQLSSPDASLMTSLQMLVGCSDVDFEATLPPDGDGSIVIASMNGRD